MIDIKSLNDDFFEIKHLTDDIDVTNFSCKKGPGLENYLIHFAKTEEMENISRTYLICDNSTKMIVGYFSLRTGLITVSRGFRKGFDAITGIELANFAVNDNYQEVQDNIPKLGSYIFANFILPLVQEISNYVGAHYLYIYALPNNRLLEHYKTMGFCRSSIKMERFVYRHVKPSYDKNCIFMFQRI